MCIALFQTPKATKWKSYLSNKELSAEEKVKFMAEDIKQIEEKAMRKEKLLQQAPADQFAYEYRNTEVNDMLIDAIKAKLAMLDQIK